MTISPSYASLCAGWLVEVTGGDDWVALCACAVVARPTVSATIPVP